MHYKRLGKYTPNIFTAIVVVGMIISLPMFLILSPTICTTPIHSAYGQNSRSHNKDNTPGLDNTTNITISGKPHLIKYSITNGKILSIIPDQSNSRISASIQPTKNGKFTIELPRKVIDSKGQGIFKNIVDSKYIVHINGQAFGVSYNEISNNANARTLAINFGKDDRVIEIKGTQMGKH
ncbi:MAG TPA: hypothetical protein VFI70_02105 [Nitrososphaeraceae archaeon]|nr:hypothetical protein [Nitrososphaeraceae archaeon]